jgi:hypothetical protein
MAGNGKDFGPLPTSIGNPMWQMQLADWGLPDYDTKHLGEWVEKLILNEREGCANCICQLCEQGYEHSDKFRKVHLIDGKPFPCAAAAIWQRWWE